MSVARARSLRKRMSPPEARLWNVLRRAPFAEFNFRRQVPLGPYYADFACHAARVVIEVDGSGHFTEAAERHDAGRDLFIAEQGYAVLRFTTSEVMNNIAGLAEALLARLPQPGPAVPGHLPPEGEAWDPPLKVRHS